MEKQDLRMAFRSEICQFHWSKGTARYIKNRSLYVKTPTRGAPYHIASLIPTRRVHVRTKASVGKKEIFSQGSWIIFTKFWRKYEFFIPVSMMLFLPGASNRRAMRPYHNWGANRTCRLVALRSDGPVGRQGTNQE